MKLHTTTVTSLNATDCNKHLRPDVEV